jgi:DNA-binding transcriptional regulator YhcF (GntR family)
MGVLVIKEKETSITIEKENDDLHDLFNSFISACIGIGHDPEEIQKIILDAAQAFNQKSN